MYYIIEETNRKGTDQTVWMCRLICAYVVRMWQKSVYSWCGSFIMWLIFLQYFIFPTFSELFRERFLCCDFTPQFSLAFIFSYPTIIQEIVLLFRLLTVHYDHLIMYNYRKKNPKFGYPIKCCNYIKILPDSNVSNRCRWLGKQCGPWSDRSFRKKGLILVYTVCSDLFVTTHRNHYGKITFFHVKWGLMSTSTTHSGKIMCCAMRKPITGGLWQVNTQTSQLSLRGSSEQQL